MHRWACHYRIRTCAYLVRTNLAIGKHRASNFFINDSRFGKHFWRQSKLVLIVEIFCDDLLLFFGTDLLLFRCLSLLLLASRSFLRVIDVIVCGSHVGWVHDWALDVANVSGILIISLGFLQVLEVSEVDLDHTCSRVKGAHNLSVGDVGLETAAISCHKLLDAQNVARGLWRAHAWISVGLFSRHSSSSLSIRAVFVVGKPKRCCVRKVTVVRDHGLVLHMLWLSRMFLLKPLASTFTLFSEIVQIRLRHRSLVQLALGLILLLRLRKRYAYLLAWVKLVFIRWGGVQHACLSRMLHHSRAWSSPCLLWLLQLFALWCTCWFAWLLSSRASSCRIRREERTLSQQWWVLTCVDPPIFVSGYLHSWLGHYSVFTIEEHWYLIHGPVISKHHRVFQGIRRIKKLLQILDLLIIFWHRLCWLLELLLFHPFERLIGFKQSCCNTMLLGGNCGLTFLSKMLFHKLVKVVKILLDLVLFFNFYCLLLGLLYDLLSLFALNKLLNLVRNHAALGFLTKTCIQKRWCRNMKICYSFI